MRPVTSSWTPGATLRAHISGPEVFHPPGRTPAATGGALSAALSSNDPCAARVPEWGFDFCGVNAGLPAIP
ncbi:hypothetical protein KCH_46810 [Kitasatospora cheerisanensis KCTC 2395]|uniref:Uncharacterized protein n=1 Tax=Kitasatospora cheerisanensis KCTC 2395 TaxID=1348663 RepID=A0A066YTB6_9ACTN|nr:hypothetical protein KCH_46810 [Kitasatospora cheerisanensis KCTC 2395]